MNASSLAGSAPAVATPTTPTTPWWRVGMVWLVISGPLIVVVAAIFTAVIAIRGADPVLTEAERNPVAGKVGTATPAVQARNHAATAR